MLRVELEDPIDAVRRVAAPPGQPGAHGVGVGAEAADVEHPADGSGGRGSRSQPNRAGPERLGSVTAMAAVEVDELTVRYGDVVAVDGISFQAQAGQITAVLGPNGAGKTTTVEVLEGLSAPLRRGGPGSSASIRSPTTPPSPAGSA